MHIVLGALIESLINEVKNSRKYVISGLTKFDSLRIPGMTIKEYINRIHKYVKCSDVCYLIAFILIDWTLNKNSNLVLSPYNAYG